jgi:hypothetical protein
MVREHECIGVPEHILASGLMDGLGRIEVTVQAASFGLLDGGSNEAGCCCLR